ncbi:MAG: LacI family DNA-binding transcriptional regulator [Vagococcus salmoninarum]
MSTIHDIAKITGYSVSTISRVLNNHPYVSDEKRARVKAVIKDLDYIPNSNARSLSYGKSLQIGVLLPLINNSWFDEMTSGVIEEASKKGYTVTILPTNYEAELEDKYLTGALAKAYDGLTILSRKSSLEKIAEYAEKVAIVCCEEIGDYPISAVYMERQQLYQKIFLELKEANQLPIGITLSRDELASPSMKQTLEAFTAVFGDLEQAVIYRECRSFEEGLEAGQFFKNHEPQPKAIFTNGDEVAAGIVTSYDSSERPIIIGQGNQLLSQVLNFSSVAHPLKEIGRAAFKELFTEGHHQIELTSQLIKREALN